ncbi:MAG: hypothetical protein A4E70_01623 [Syntrophus sp. PtaU1.Bin005]|nr:MAG: hypothetical protein A4E69_00419 [Syntrophus sp. PtaB.Bin138]OPY80679.1 MAG: hypothetical protein A4E70_01623 [Syntrophus sp. PtaU1.Bin005]
MNRTMNRIWRLCWKDLPLINFLFLAVSVSSAVRLNLSPPRDDLYWTFVFPLAVTAALCLARFRNVDHLERAFNLTILLGTSFILAAMYFAAKPKPMTTDELLCRYEFSALANAALIGVHAWRRSGRLAALFFGPVAAYGAVLENGGILLGYFTEVGYSMYLRPFPAPLATMAGWITVFYLVMSLTWEFRLCIPCLARSAIGSALVATACALCMDFQLDPLATAAGFWQWNHLLTLRLLGVPLLNFVAWASAVFPFSLMILSLQTRQSIEPEVLGCAENLKRVWRRIPLALAASAVLFFASMAVFEGGFSGPTFAVLENTLRNYGCALN